MADLIEPARAVVRELGEVVGWLAAVLLPGTAKPYRAPQMSADRRATLDADARLERLERSGIAPGETPAPMDLDVADLLAEILTTADELADRVCLAVQRPVGPPASSAFADPAPMLDVVTRYLPLAVTVDLRLLDDVTDRCGHLIERAHRLLGLLGDGQLLAALCPWCDGRTSHAPTGAAKTLRVRAQLPAGRKTMTGLDPADVRWFVVCEGGLCEPPAAECGARVRGRPAWPLRSEADWLAGRIEHAAKVRVELAAAVAAVFAERAS